MLTLQEMQTLYYWGFSIKEIAEYTGINHVKMWRLLTQIGTHMRPRGRPLSRFNPNMEGIH